MNTWGNKIRISIFGESHGKAIGAIIDGIPAGFEIDLEQIKSEMKRRKPGKNEYSTARKEDDNVEILSGILGKKTTGTPICGIIYNHDIESKSYVQGLIRPGHADYTAYMKFNGFNDYRGGGQFSGRITAPLVFAGAICKQVLCKKYGVSIYSHIKSIQNIEDSDFSLDCDLNNLKELKKEDFPTLNKEIKEKMKNLIMKAKNNKNSVGGIVEGIILGMKAGIGEPFFNSVESSLSQLLFSIPSIKGVEFGEGFEITKKTGVEANDEFYYDDTKKVKTRTNSNGGILGGITNGMPINFKVAIKPTPSIACEQKTININTKENDVITTQGRHDPCIVPRIIPVIEATTAIGILDLLEF